MPCSAVGVGDCLENVLSHIHTLCNYSFIRFFRIVEYLFCFAKMEINNVSQGESRVPQYDTFMEESHGFIYRIMPQHMPGMEFASRYS
jgi:hypothetical protein